MSCSTRLILAFAALLALALQAGPARSADCPTACDDPTGVVVLPAGAGVSLPFAKGEKVYVSSGYGPNGGSTGHCRSQDPSCANDYFALDLVLPGHPNGGQGEPVLAAQSGTVLDAGWATEGWASYGQRVYVQHDFGDGHPYTTVYAHLDTIQVAKGQKVSKGEAVGTLGHSSKGIQQNPDMGPHLHFSIHRDAKFGGSGTGGSYAGRAVRPEPLDGQSGFAKGQTLTSANDGTVTPPPPACDIVIQPNGETVIEDTSPCAEKKGTPAESTAGLGGHAFHSALDNPDPDYAEGLFWNLVFAQGGDYDVSAWIPAGIPNLTSQAVYKTQHAGASSFATVDQAASAGGWTLVGRYGFAAGAAQWVRLGDNYTSAPSKGKTFVMDALKIAPASGGSGGQGGGGAGGAGGTGGSAGAGARPDGGGGAGNAADVAGESSGCACRAGATSRFFGTAVLAAFALAMFGVRRRRRQGAS
jgi:MYXO-CTERM domain-containing protein